MADLTYIEKEVIENFLSMKSGYVMDFSDRTFQEFIGLVTGLDIKDETYNYHTGSKANRLRAFLKSESNYTVGKLLKAFLDYWLSKVQTGQINPNNDEALYKECTRIAERLVHDNGADHLEAIKASTDNRDFKLLAKSIKESIEKNEPESALDRLHTFVVKFIRHLCDKRKIAYGKDEPLHSIYGKYIKYISEKKLFDSVMTERILKYAIHVLEAFNDIRNNKSFAHDNPILNYSESLLIFNSVSNAIKFIQAIEDKDKETQRKATAKPAEDWDLPF